MSDLQSSILNAPSHYGVEWGGLVWSSESATPEALISHPSWIIESVDKDGGTADTVAALQLPLDKIFVLTLSFTRSCRASWNVEEGITPSQCILQPFKIWAIAQMANVIQQLLPDMSIPPPIQFHLENLEPKTSYACMEAQSICWVQLPICTHTQTQS